MRSGSERLRRSSCRDGSRRDSTVRCPPTSSSPISPTTSAGRIRSSSTASWARAPSCWSRLPTGSVRSISLAGSADPGDPASAGFFDTEKMTREHALAADSVDTALALFCTRLGRSERTVATYGDIQHLSTVFEGDVRPGTTVTDLLAALHPTAAVAGTPTQTAVELIRELEGHERGRYAGPVGWFDREGDGEFAIALRCGEIDGAGATLYTGAGIVEGSDAAMEFERRRSSFGRCWGHSASAEAGAHRPRRVVQAAASLQVGLALDRYHDDMCPTCVKPTPDRGSKNSDILYNGLHSGCTRTATGLRSR